MREIIHSRFNFDYWQEYFLVSRDQQSRIWTFPEGASLSALGETEFRAADGSWWITVVDQTQGKKPVLWSYDAFAYGSTAISVHPIALFDTQLVNEVHKFVSRRSTMETARREAVLAFLRMIVSKKFDFSPYFYFLEAVAKSDPGRRDAFVSDRARTVFALQTMDTQRFLETGDVVRDATAEKRQLEFQGVAEIDALMAQYGGAVSDEAAAEIESKVEFSYACLLKAGLIRHQVRGNARTQYLELRNFQEKTLGISLAPERFVGLCYFTNPQRYQRFIPLQRGMKYSKLVRDLWANAWDLFLVRLPEILLENPPANPLAMSHRCPIGYICTAEHAVRDIAATRSLEIVFQLRPDHRATSNIVGYDLEGMERALGADMFNEIVVDEYRWQEQRQLNPAALHPLSGSELKRVIAELEAEAKAMCKPE